MKRDSTAYGAVRPAWDRGDCSVRALAVATGCSYEQASAVFSAAGRQLKKGTTVLTSAKVYEEWLGMEVIADVKGWPIVDFIMAHPKGRFILHRRGHAFAVVNGVLHDWEEGTKARSEIVSAWKVTDKALGKMERLKELFK